MVRFAMMDEVAEQSSIAPVPAHAVAADEPVCPNCGYDLRGIASDRCPECGFAVDRASMSVSRIPWEHRKQLGRWRAYWRTNLLVLFRPKLLAEEMNRPVGLRDARKFRHLTVFLAWIPAAACGMFFYSTLDPRRGLSISIPEGNMLGWILEGLCLATGLFAIWLFLLAVSGAGSFFFHPSNMPVARQNRAIAISYYGCAALAWLWLPAAILALNVAVMSQSEAADDFARRAGFWLYVGAIVVFAPIGVALWPCAVYLMRRCTQSSSARQFIFSIYLPIAWLFLFCLCWGLVSAVVLISLMILSLT